MISVCTRRDFVSLRSTVRKRQLGSIEQRSGWMVRWLRVAMLIGIAAAVLGVARDALANPLHRAEDGVGIKVGQRSTFHPGFALVTGVDTNVFYEAKVEGPQAAAYVTPTGWLGIGNRQIRDGMLMSPPERSGRIMDYNISTILGFRQYLARRDNVRQQSRLTGGVQLRLNFLPGRRVSVTLEEDFFRYAQPSNYDAGADFNFNRIDHRGALTFFVRPGGGRLSFGAGYRSHILRFQNTADDVAKGNRILNGMLGELKWRFLPKTALLFQYTFDHTFYTDCCTEIGTGRNEDNFAHRILGGVRGQVLKKVTLDVRAGWGLGFYSDDPNGPNFSSFIGDLGVNVYPTLRNSLHFSLYRSFQDSLLGNYFVDIGGRAGVRHQFRWNMIAGLGVGVVGRRYAGLPVEGFEDESITGYEGRGAAQFQRRDVLFNLDAKIEQPLGKIWALGLYYDLQVDSASFQTFFVPGPEDPGRPVDIAGYQKHLIMFLAAVRI
jgi:hypothetical protein